MTLTTPDRGLLAGHSHSIETMRHAWVPPQAAPTAGAWPAANLAIYVPVAVRQRVIVRSIWFSSASTGTGNYDIGLYDSGGTRIASSTAQSKPASAIEVVYDITDTTIGPGTYYMALVISNNSDTVYRYAPSAPIALAYGALSESLGSTALPATASWALDQTLAVIPVMGMFLVTTVT